MGDTRIVAGFEVPAGLLYTGERVNLSTLPRPGPSASEREWMNYLWWGWCKDAKAAVDRGDGSFDMPPLLDWRRHDKKEVFTICMPGIFGGNPQIGLNMRNIIQASQGAEKAVLTRVESNVWRLVLSHFVLPKKEMFSPDNVPESDDEVDLGLLSEGSRLVWSTKEQTNAAMIGQNGSGKTEAARMALAQFWRKGWEITVVSPNEEDSTFDDFVGLERVTLLFGSDDEAMIRNGEWFAEDEERMRKRALERAAAKALWWGDTHDKYGNPIDPSVWTGGKSVVYMDESSDLVIPQKGLEPEAVTLAKLQTGLTWRRRHKKGRKFRQTCITSDQQPSVGNLGGGDVLNEIGFVLAMRSLRPTFVDTLFPKTTSLDVQEVLIEPGSPPGRGVARGAKMPDGELGESAVNDAAVQVSWALPHHIAAMLGKEAIEPGPISILPPPEPDPVSVVEPSSPGVRPAGPVDGGRAAAVDVEVGLDELEAWANAPALDEEPPPAPVVAEPVPPAEGKYSVRPLVGVVALVMAALVVIGVVTGKPAVFSFGLLWLAGAAVVSVVWSGRVPWWSAVYTLPVFAIGGVAWGVFG